MQTLLLGSYILVWPAITVAMMTLICHATLRDYREAKRTNTEMV